MIEINLLPKELRKKKKILIDIADIPVIPLAVGAVSMCILLHILVLSLIISNKYWLTSLHNEWKQLEPEKGKAEKVQMDLAALKKKVFAIRKIAKPDIDWAGVLTGLSEAVIPGIWLNDVDLTFLDSEGKKSTVGNVPGFLVITGCALGESDEASLFVAKFITSLKNTQKFADCFGQIELENIKSQNVEKEEVMLFNLNCRFKQIETVPALGTDKNRV